MRFRTASSNASYTVLARDQIKDNIGRVTGKVPGLRAEFLGPEHICDTEEQQRQNRWSDEQRLEVERHLLSHKNFRRMRVFDLGGPSPEAQRGNAAQPELDLAPGQTLPDEHLEFCMTQRWWKIANTAEQPEPATEPELEPERVCLYRALSENNEVVECNQTASPGHDYCEDHLAVVAASTPS
jgi:hypothetical protein